MASVHNRPFYHEFAWAYDLMIEGPIQRRCDFFQAAASQRGLPANAFLLDAGCGSGSYAIALGRREYRVTGLDRSPELIALARRKGEVAGLKTNFQVGDLLQLPADPKYDGILCRGVLNDLLEDQQRQQALRVFGQALRPGGLLVLDVREWHATASRKSSEPVFEKRIRTDRGALTFKSVTRLDRARQLLRVAEHHTLEESDQMMQRHFEFVMRPWTEEELLLALKRAGFGAIACYGDYDEDHPVGYSDRIVAIASRVTDTRGV